MIGPLWGEADETKRIAGWKAVDKYIAENVVLCAGALATELSLASLKAYT